MTDDPLRQARASLASGDYSRAVQLTSQMLAENPANDAARILNEEAQSRMEADPFIQQFAARCEREVAAGNIAQAKALLEKARALDADNPAVQRMQQMIASPAGASFGFDSGTSFVVDQPDSAKARAGAPAADFGFTFEEDAETGGGFSAGAVPPPAAPSFAFDTDSPSSSGDGFSSFSFETPAAPAPAAGAGYSFGAQPEPASGEFDFSSAAMSNSTEDRQKAEQYLAEGDRALERGDYQAAIDLWSRVFLIDVTNEAAAERIERAKAKKRENEQRVDAVLNDAISTYDRRDYESARVKFAEVLLIDPDNSTASEYMQRLTSQGTEGGAAGIERPYAPSASAKSDIFDDDNFAASDSIAPPEPKTAAPPSKGKKTSKSAKPAARKKSPLPVKPIAAALGAVALVAVAWFVWTTFFGKPDYDPAATQAILKHAGDLAQQGKVEQAIAALEEIKPDDPQHDKAVIMISDLQQKKTAGVQTFGGKTASVYFRENIAAAHAAFDAHDYVGAKAAFEKAMKAQPLPPGEKLSYDAALMQVGKLDASKALFQERKYQDALTNLQSLYSQDPSNLSVQRLIVDSHFNLGVIALQEERLPDATREFGEVLKLDPGDELARRSRELAVRYDKRNKDLLYRIYVKYLPLRQIT